MQKISKTNLSKLCLDTLGHSLPYHFFGKIIALIKFVSNVTTTTAKGTFPHLLLSLGRQSAPGLIVFFPESVLKMTEPHLTPEPGHHLEHINFVTYT